MDQELFDYCRQLEVDYSNAFAYGIGVNQWDGKKQAMYAHGPLRGLYRENSQILRRYLRQEANNEKLLCLLKKYIRDSRNLFEEDFKREYGLVKKIPDALEKCRREEEIKLKALNKENILEWMAGYNALILEDLAFESDKIRLRFLELYIKYEYYKKTNDRTIAQAEIDRVYASILNADVNYTKWKLISISNCRKLLALDGPRIYDSSLDKTIFLFTPKSVATVISELCVKNLIGTCSFLGSSITDGKIDKEYLKEAVEFGRIFSLALEELPPVTKLYSEHLYSYENQLWVKCENNDFTFEELLSRQADEDTIKTQMVHLQYSKNGDDYFISHLDHEYIFYTRDEYENRKLSMKQKGQACKRQKTFKIDDSKIPFDYPCKVFRRAESGSMEKLIVPFIYFVLNAYFINKDLLEEYFADLLEACTNS